MKAAAPAMMAVAATGPFFVARSIPSSQPAPSRAAATYAASAALSARGDDWSSGSGEH
jgi:hypothetical protein